MINLFIMLASLMTMTAQAQNLGDFTIPEGHFRTILVCKSTDRNQPSLRLKIEENKVSKSAEFKFGERRFQVLVDRKLSRTQPGLVGFIGGNSEGNVISFLLVLQKKTNSSPYMQGEFRFIGRTSYKPDAPMIFTAKPLRVVCKN